MQTHRDATTPGNIVANPPPPRNRPRFHSFQVEALAEWVTLETPCEETKRNRDSEDYGQADECRLPT